MIRIILDHSVVQSSNRPCRLLIVGTETSTHNFALLDESPALSGSQPAFSRRLRFVLRCGTRKSAFIGCSGVDRRRQSKTCPKPHEFMLLFLLAEAMRISWGVVCGHKSNDSSVAAIGCRNHCIVHLEGCRSTNCNPIFRLSTPTTLKRHSNATCVLI
jgi:hypothetical protein